MASTRVQTHENGPAKPTRGFTRRTIAGRAVIAAAGVLGLPIGAARSTLAGPANIVGVHPSAQIDASTLVIMDNLPASWRTLDPAFFYEGNPSAAMYLVYETLYHAPDGDSPDDIRPLMALEMPQFSEDRLTVTIRLREDVTFSNSGNRFTSADVIFSWNRLKHVGFPGAYLAIDFWTTIEAPDDYTVVLSLPTPNANLAAVMVAPMMSITDKVAVEALGGTDAEPTSEEDSPEILANLAAQEEIDRVSVGSGPFRVAKWDLNSEVILDRNEEYWGDAPQIDRAIWRNALDVNAQLQSVQIGEADIAMAVNVEELDNLGQDLSIIQGRSLALQYMGLNLREDMGGPVAIRDVRQAMAHAIDYQGIIEGLLLGNGVRPATAIPLPLDGSEAALDLAIPTDVLKAQEFWDASGVGEATIQIDYPSDREGRGGVNMQSLATKIQADLERIEGLTIQLAPMPNSQRSALYRSGEYQVTVVGWVPDFPGIDSFATPFFGSSGSNARRVGFSDPEIDLLIDQAAAEQDPDAREQLYVEIQRMGIDASPYIVLYQPEDVKVAGLNVQGVQVHPVYQLQLRGASKQE